MRAHVLGCSDPGLSRFWGSKATWAKIRRLTSFARCLLACSIAGGTVGSGVFVLCGLIAHEYAGPAVVLSWLTAGSVFFFPPSEV
eukprot:scaffold1272_cov250-Pinguiococcus_pyrenoidosus.AAC.70